MLIDYIKQNYAEGDPIFLEELDYKSSDALRQEMKRLVDIGELARAYNGVYYIPFKTIFNTNGEMSIDKFVQKKYLSKNDETIGYITGLSLANKYGFTTQVPSVIEVTSNAASTKQRKLKVSGYTLIVYSPVIKITEENKTSLEFLDLMQNIDKYSEVSGEELKSKLDDYLNQKNINFSLVKDLIGLYPDRIYKNIYNVGLMNKLI